MFRIIIISKTPYIFAWVPQYMLRVVYTYQSLSGDIPNPVAKLKTSPADVLKINNIIYFILIKKSFSKSHQFLIFYISSSKRLGRWETVTLKAFSRSLGNQQMFAGKVFRGTILRSDNFKYLLPENIFFLSYILGTTFDKQHLKFWYL